MTQVIARGGAQRGASFRFPRVQTSDASGRQFSAPKCL